MTTAAAAGPSPLQARRPHDTGFRPVLIAEVELSAGELHVDVPRSQSGWAYRKAQLLVRLHRRPLGVVTVPITDGHVADDARQVIWRELGERIRGHLEADGGDYAANGAPCGAAARLGSRPRPTVSVVVPTCNRLSTLLPCIDSILASTVPPLEVIVVENRPAGSKVAAALAALYPDAPVRYREEAKPGVSRARNRGLAAVKGKLVAFVDDDVIVDPDWISNLMVAFDDHPEADCVTGQILPLELESPAQLWVEQYGGFSKGFDQVVFDESRRAVDPLFPYDCGKFGSGANAAFRSEAVRQLRGFDVVLGGARGVTSGEDIDLFLRVLLSGHTLVYEPSALVWHRNRASLPELRRQLFHYGRGLAAVITKQLVAGTQRGDLLRRIPAGFRYLLSPKSGKNVHRRRDYPRSLAFLELLGMATGPLAYLLSRRRAGVLIIR